MRNYSASEINERWARGVNDRGSERECNFRAKRMLRGKGGKEGKGSKEGGEAEGGEGKRGMMPFG